MEKLLRGGVFRESKEIQALEQRLSATLIPVEPRIEYIHELKRNLLKDSNLELIEPRPALLQKILLAAAGLVSGALLLVLGVLGVRSLIALLNSRGIIQQLKSGLQGKKTVPLNPVV